MYVNNLTTIILDDWSLNRCETSLYVLVKPQQDYSLKH